jgi:hypothetical protein
MKNLSSLTLSKNRLDFTTMPEISVGVVNKNINNGWQITTTNDCITAIKAASCLLTPAIGDEVLFVQVPPSRAFILAVLSQANITQQTYHLSPMVALTANDGQLNLQAQSLNCITAESISLTSNSLHFFAERAKVNVSNYDFNAEYVHNSIAHLQNTVAVCDETISNYNFNAEQVFEYVTEIQHQVLGNYHSIVQQNYHLDCDTMDVYAEGDIKLQGDQIALG